MGRGSRSPPTLFLKNPEKGFLTSPDLAGDGEGSRRAPPPTLGALTLTSLCSSLAPKHLPGSLFLTFHSSGLKTVRRVRQTVTPDLGPATQKPLTPDCDFQHLQ